MEQVASGADWRVSAGVSDKASPTHRSSPRRAALGLAIVMGLVGALVFDGGTHAVEPTTTVAPELATLIRFMAAVKAAAALAAAGAVWWRLAVPVGAGLLSLYLAAATAMAAGPVMIWSLAHVGLGALLLHGGLLVTLVAIWRDAAVSERLAEIVAARRRREPHA